MPQENFQGILWDAMPKKIFNRLNSIDTELSWELCRADVISQLLGDTAYAVPFLDEAKVFQPFSVIGKIKVGGKKYLKYLGHLKDLIAPCENMAQLYQEKKRVDDDYFTGGGRIEQVY